MFKTFNMGIGMILVCSTENESKILDLLPKSFVIGNVHEGQGAAQVRLDF